MGLYETQQTPIARDQGLPLLVERVFRTAEATEVTARPADATARPADAFECWRSPRWPSDDGWPYAGTRRRPLPGHHVHAPIPGDGTLGR